MYISYLSRISIKFNFVKRFTVPLFREKSIGEYKSYLRHAFVGAEEGEEVCFGADGHGAAAEGGDEVHRLHTAAMLCKSTVLRAMGL